MSESPPPAGPTSPGPIPAGPTSGGLRRRAARGRGAELGGELLTAAMDLLRETGSEEAVSLRAVADRVGVSVPSIYLHYSDKQALLDAVCATVFGSLEAAMRTATGPDAFERLRQQGNAYVRFALANPEHYRIVMSRQGADDIASGAFGHLLDGVREVVALGIFQGDPVVLGLQLWAAAHGLASLLIAKPDFPWPAVEQLVDDTICMAGSGLAVRDRLPEGLSPAELVRRLERLSRP